MMVVGGTLEKVVKLGTWLYAGYVCVHGGKLRYLGASGDLRRWQVRVGWG